MAISLVGADIVCHGY